MPSIETITRRASPSSNTQDSSASLAIVLVPLLLIIGCFIIILVLVLRCCHQSDKRRALRAEEDTWFKDPKYVEDRLDWLHEAIADISSKLNKKSADISNEDSEKEMSVKLDEIHGRYLGVEDLLRRYGTWQIRTKKEIKIVDWDEFGIKERGRDNVVRLSNALSAREAFLVVAEEAWGTTEFLSLEGTRIDEARKFFDTEGSGYMYLGRDYVV